MKRLEDLTEPELGALMTNTAKLIEGYWQKYMDVEKPLFCLVVFSDPAIAQYIGNCRREDMIAAMRETADRLDRRQDVPR